MAKKKTQFNKAKYNKESGILSYNYLGGEAGKGRGAVSIIKQGNDWFFADKNGKVRTDVGINGKLTPTHMSNLKRDGIFAAAKINEQGEKLSKAEIKAGPDLGKPGTDSGGSVLGSGDLPGASGGGLPLADRSNLRLRDANEAITSNVDSARAPVNYDQTLERRGMPTASAPAQTWEGAGQMRLNTDPNSVPSSAVTAAPTQSLSGQNELTGFGKENMSGPVWGAPVDAQPSGNLATQGISEWGDKGYASEQAMSNSYSSASPSGWSGMAAAGAPTVETQSIGFGGRQEFVGDNTFNTPQSSTTPGVTDKKDNPWGAADWEAVGSVMKGVGGLAGAWTGIQNYKLARDAYNTQKNQWQADYNQRLKAYEDNKTMANQEIDAKNRVLAARGQGSNVIKHI